MAAKAQTNSSDFQPDTLIENVSADTHASRTRADFDGLLELAEQLQQSYEKKVADSQSLSLTGMIYGLVLITELLVSYAGGGVLILNRINTNSSPHNNATYLICTSVVGVVIVLGIVTFFYFNSLRQRFQQIKRHIRDDERDLSEVVELLREIEPVYAKAESLSAMDRIQIRIRLSRFGIGSSSKSETTNAAREMKEDFEARKKRVDEELLKPF